MLITLSIFSACSTELQVANTVLIFYSNIRYLHVLVLGFEQNLTLHAVKFSYCLQIQIIYTIHSLIGTLKAN